MASDRDEQSPCLMGTWILQCQVLTGEHRDVVAVLWRFRRNRGEQRQLDTLSGLGASQGLG